jgi:murein DD-endopeptidase MepM/ murein hydrolase activator NlpD
MARWWGRTGNTDDARAVRRLAGRDGGSVRSDGGLGKQRAHFLHSARRKWPRSAVVFALVATLVAASPVAAESLLDSLQSRLEAAKAAIGNLTGQRDQAARQVDALRGTSKSLAEELKRLDAEIIEAVTRLRDAESELVRLEGEETALEDEIRDGLAAVQGRADAYGAHLRALYKATRTSTFEQLLAAQSLGDAVRRVSAMRAVSQVDTRLLVELRRETASLTAARQALEKSRIEAANRRDEIAARQAQLEEARARHAETVQKADAETKAAEARLTDYDRQAKEQASQISGLQAQYQAQLREIERQRQEEAAREAAARAEMERATAQAQASVLAAQTAQAQATAEAVATAQMAQARALATVYAQGTVVSRQTEVAFATRAAAVTRTPGAALPTPVPMKPAVTPVPITMPLPGPKAVQTPTSVIIPGAVRTNLLQPSTAGFVWPVEDPDVTTEFGERNFAQSFHTGIDLAVPIDSPVRAAADGIVLKVGLAIPGQPASSYGMIVVVANGPTTATLYAHLQNRGRVPPVASGQMVKRGQIIGYVGLTGLTSGPHLHFEVLVNDQPINPRRFLPRGPV